MKLVIVESPAKCSKIQSYLGDGYRVIATMGHIRALEESLNSVGIDRGWEPTYVELAAKRDAIRSLRAAAKGCDVILASDDDREGEGIAAHVCAVLGLNPATTPRIVFHEITRPAILAAVAAPRRLDMHKVHAQQARAMLDLLVGFTISKVLWARVAPKLSAGRCQTPALRLVVERDMEVEGHTATARWVAKGTFTSAAVPAGSLLEATAAKEWEKEADALAALERVHAHPAATIQTRKESVSTSAPPKPLITSTLQQEASNLHGLSPKVTMQAAQKLYENGHITYMRTDNAVLSREAAEAIQSWIVGEFGREWVGAPAALAPAPKPAGGAGASAATLPAAQAAHEAIRPTHPELREVDVRDPVQQTVYRLIWRRAVQSQMAPARTDVRRITLTINADESIVWNAEQTKVNFLGWRALERNDAAKQTEEAAVWTATDSNFVVGAPMRWMSLQVNEQFSKPKGRYTEASLISELERRGIGRPSTFASLVSTLLDREYVEKTNVEGVEQTTRQYALAAPNRWPPTRTLQTHKTGAEKNKLRATGLGRSVCAYLVREYGDLFQYEFTATMEQELDRIAQGEAEWKGLLQSTWDTYKERYAEHTAGGAAAAATAKAARERVLGDGIKVILSRKGPLFVREPAPAPVAVAAAEEKEKGKKRKSAAAKAKAEFAPLPPSLTFEAATLEQARAAFAAAARAREGELFGTLEDGSTIQKKKGPFGWYVECGGTRVSLKGGETLEDVRAKLSAKAATETGAAAYSRTVGEFTIKRGPYGLYFFKHALKRTTFVTFPADKDPDTVTATECGTLYSAGLAKKRHARKRPAKKEA